MDHPETRAPRLQAYLDRTSGAIRMSRRVWGQLTQAEDEIVYVELAETPLGAVLGTGKLVGSFVERLEDGEIRIVVFREDPKDAPNNINKDNYIVVDLNASPFLDQAVRSASTTSDLALQGFVEDYVFVEPAEKDAEHHLPEVPARYKIALKRA